MSQLLSDYLKSVQEAYTIPAIVRKYDWREFEVYIYPYSLFDDINYQSKTSFYLINKKGERRELLKELIDLHINGEINIWMLHLGLFMIYKDPYRYYEDDFNETVLGKRRAQYISQLPRFETISNDEYIIEAWSSLSRQVKSDAWDVTYNPSLKNVRILFESDFFGYHAGIHYTDADWVEPISNARDQECKTWTKEKDPMTTVVDDNYIYGPIVLGTDGSGRRHFVQDKPIHAGTGIEIKFGDGWIHGRYEYSFQAGGPISIHMKNDTIFISNGHEVRVKK